MRYIVLLLAALAWQNAQAELMLNPTRVVFTKNQRAAQVELINNGGAPATYRIGLVNRRMSETGEFTKVDTADEGELFAAPMLSYSPRQITLQPGTAQVVRLMVRKPEGLADGEYRSHLHFEKLADGDAMGGSVESAGKEDQKIGVVLKTLVGASIPVIVRHGAGDAAVTLSQLELLAASGGKAPVLSFRIERRGMHSVYGDLSATLIARAGGEHVVARAGGVAVYTPNPRRKASMLLQLAPGVSLARGQLLLTYREPAEAGGRLLAEALLALP